VQRKVTLWSSIDWVTILVYLVLVLLGWINIFSAEYDEEYNGVLDFSRRYGKQIIWIAAAFLVAFLVVMIDSRFYFFFAYIIYGIIILLLFTVLIFGREIHSARSWFEFGTVRFQPSEFAKLATGLAFAKYLSSKSISINRVKSLFNIALIILIPVLLILLQPDIGSTLVFLSFVVVLYREGLSVNILFAGIIVTMLFLLTFVFDKLIIISGIVLVSFIIFWIIERKMKYVVYAVIIFAVIGGLFYGLKQYFKVGLSYYFILMISVGLSGLVYIFLSYRRKIRNVSIGYFLLMSALGFTFSVNYVFNNLLEPYQQKRINILLGVESDPYGSGYNINQSKIAIGSGGFSGKGFLKGTQTKFKFVPEQSTDFIFCTVGEEWGFIGTFTVIVLFSILLIRIVYLAERQRSSFARIYGYVVLSVISFHVVVNIGMTIGLLPVIGIPLPFFSYGGSSLWAFTILLFIFLRMDASRIEYLI
jgi:rod shape determining protein RodA